MAKPIRSEDLVIHVLNVGFGDAIVVELPADEQGQRRHAVVDCYLAKKTLAYLDRLAQARPAQRQLAFLCVTHPHRDHILGALSLLKDATCRPLEFWDSGFRHNSTTYRDVLNALCEQRIRLIRVSSGMEWYFGRVRITALAPSVALRNRYATYGVDSNNASIVLRLEHHDTDVMMVSSLPSGGTPGSTSAPKAGQAVVILGGDAEFDSWARISDEFPHLERTSENDPLVEKKIVDQLACDVVKVSHHGSMHSVPLNVFERMAPQLAIVSTKQALGEKQVGSQKIMRGMFPHQTTALSLEEVGARVATTDGSYESTPVEAGAVRDPELAHPGSVVVVVPPAGRARWIKLSDREDQVPNPPTEI